MIFLIQAINTKQFIPQLLSQAFAVYLDYADYTAHCTCNH